LNRPKLREKLNALGVHGKLGSEQDLEKLRRIRSNEPIEDYYLGGWKAVLPQLRSLEIPAQQAVLLAPLDVEEYGLAHVNGGALMAAFAEGPLHFDRDGFWIVGLFGAVLADFEKDHLQADVLWRRYAPTGA
jgi:hypothetical protein